MLFWRKGSWFGDVLLHVNVQGLGKVSKRHPRCTKEIAGISRLKGSEMVLVTVTGKTGRESRLAVLQHTSDSWMQDLVDGFPEPGGLVVDPFFGRFGTAKSCLKIPSLRRFRRSEVDADLFAASTDALETTDVK